MKLWHYGTLQMFWFASASLADPYCQSMWISVCVYVGSRALA